MNIELFSLDKFCTSHLASWNRKNPENKTGLKRKVIKK